MEDEALATTRETSQQESGPRFQLQFVTTVSVNVPSKAEQKRNQKIIRQTVMKNFRQQQKSEKLKPKQRSNRGLAAASSLNATGEEVDIDASSSSASSTSSRAQTSSWSESDSKKKLESKECKTRSPQASPTWPILGSPLSPLGAGRTDPFRPHAADNKFNMNELLDHSLTILWPAFRPHGTATEQPNIPAAWLMASNTRPVTMHSMLFGAQVHMDVLRGPQMNVDNPIRLYHKIQTVRLLKEELEHPGTLRVDEIILAVLALSANEIETVANNIKKKVPSPFHSPLTSVQWLDVYGRVSHIKAHVLAMRCLVDQKGGLESLELEGLAEVIAVSDILGATQKLLKPHWPLLERTLKFTPLELDDSVKFALTKLGHSFPELRYLGLSEEMGRVIQSMVDLTIVIDCHCRGTSPIENFTIFIDRRNSVQHRLMSLPSGEELLDDEVTSTCLYESIRHAVFIYSAAVTFPLPAISGQFHRLASILQPLLESSKFDPCWRKCPKVLLWILVLGGIAASDTTQRHWFVSNVAIVAKVLKAASWEQVVEIMEGFLWLDSACETGGQILWAEVMAYRLSHSIRSKSS